MEFLEEFFNTGFCCCLLYTSGQEITVVVKEDDSVYDIAKTLESKGLVEDAKVFWIQEKLSNYKGQMKPGTYLLSTCLLYTSFPAELTVRLPAT